MKNIKSFKLFENSQTVKELRNFTEDMLLNLTDIGFETKISRISINREFQIRISNRFLFEINEMIMDVLKPLDSYSNELGYNMKIILNTKLSPIMNIHSYYDSRYKSNFKNVNQLLSYNGKIIDLKYLKEIKTIDIYFINKN